MGEVILVLGGMRSGKTRRAETLAADFAPVTYVATALADHDDPEMTARITRHRESRPKDWATKEVPRDLEAVLPALVAVPGAVVIDCVTLWLTNLILGLGGGPALDDTEALATVERTAKVARGEATVVWVANEVGSGVVPENALARRFADLQGLANQILAAASDAVYLCVAGLPLRLK
ncbi:MAG: adenosyl cobinamide kinase/adenosyl cobinamide phosphate guanylyltransferase [Planctomycetota bacterium]|nr:adenosyl cobinamide kinase/adenosyl cobinamide phosphate guanylyltransferase [Planctomycetota bacterium]